MLEYPYFMDAVRSVFIYLCLFLSVCLSLPLSISVSLSKTVRFCDIIYHGNHVASTLFFIEIMMPQHHISRKSWCRDTIFHGNHVAQTSFLTKRAYFIHVVLMKHAYFIRVLHDVCTFFMMYARCPWCMRVVHDVCAFTMMIGFLG